MRKVTNYRQLVEAIKNYCIDGMDSAAIDSTPLIPLEDSLLIQYLEGKHTAYDRVLSFILSAEKDIPNN